VRIKGMRKTYSKIAGGENIAPNFGCEAQQKKKEKMLGKNCVKKQQGSKNTTSKNHVHCEAINCPKE